VFLHWVAVAVQQVEMPVLTPLLVDLVAAVAVAVVALDKRVLLVWLDRDLQAAMEKLLDKTMVVVAVVVQAVWDLLVLF
jgi:hypothetical protein